MPSRLGPCRVPEKDHGSPFWEAQSTYIAYFDFLPSVSLVQKPLNIKNNSSF